MSIEAMKQALEAFRKIHEGCGEVKKDNLSKESNQLATLVRKDCNFAMAELRQAIEQAEKQEPVAWADMEVRGEDKGLSWTPGYFHTQPLYTAPVHASDILQECVDETAKDRHEFECPRCGHCCKPDHLRDATKKVWVGLTDEEVADYWVAAFNENGLYVQTFASLIEARLKEKNT